MPYQPLLSRIRILIIVLIGLLAGCMGDEEPIVSTEPAESPEPEPADEPEPTARVVPGRFYLEVDLSDPPSLTDVEMPSGYLDVPLEFVPVPDAGIPSGETALVASDQAMFWPGLETVTAADLENLGPSENIPIGTVLGIGEAVVNGDGRWDNLFEFENDWNWFYPVKIDGVKGLIWGADLTGFDLAPDELNYLTWLYNRPARSDMFISTNGHRTISGEIQAGLTENHLAFEAVSPGEYQLNMTYPDDMVSLYQAAAKDRAQTLFLSTDLYMHSLHLVFDRYLSDTEERYFHPKLVALTEEFRMAVGALRDQDDETSPRYTETLA